MRNKSFLINLLPLTALIVLILAGCASWFSSTKPDTTTSATNITSNTSTDVSHESGNISFGQTASSPDKINASASNNNQNEDNASASSISIPNTTKQTSSSSTTGSL